MAVRIQLTGDWPAEVSGFLDVSDTVSVPINLTVSDLKDLSRRKGGFTKTVLLDGTKNNNIILGHLFDVNIDAGQYDRNKRQPATIIQEGQPVLEGYMQLLSVNKKALSNGTGDQQIQYEVTVRDESSGFYTAISDAKLDNIDFSDLDHFYSTSNVMASITNDWTDGYKYVWPMSTDNTYLLSELHPGIYAIQIWDRIFGNAGYTYEWDSIDDNDVQFKKLLIPYGGSTPEVSQEDINAATVITSDTSLTVNYTQPLGNQVPYQVPVVLTETYDPSSAYAAGIYTNPYYLHGSPDGQKTNMRVKVNYSIVLDNTSASDAYMWSADGDDPNLVYNAAAGPMVYRYQPSLNTRVNGTPQIDNYPFGPLVTSIQFAGTYSIPPGETTIATNTVTKEIVIPAPLYDIFGGGYREINPGDTIQPTFGIETDDSAIQPYWSNTALSPLVTANRCRVNVKLVIHSIDMWIVPAITSVGFGGTIRMNKYLPQGMKQRDFIKGIMTLYNLYVIPDKGNPNNIILKKRDQWYDEGLQYDWTDKWMTDLNTSITFATDVTSRRQILTYKAGKDIVNKGYEANVGEVYGAINYIFSDENQKGETKMELPFEPSPIVKTDFGAYVHGIVGADPKTGVRLVYDAGATFSTSSYKIYDTADIVGYSGTQYNYSGHFNDPITPTLDLNFGVCDYYFYNDWEGDTPTNQNMYNLHWRRTMGQINTGKVMEGYFNLSVKDIVTIRLNDRVYVKDSWWNIQEITDYEPNNRQPTKVKLISVDGDQKFAKFGRIGLPDIPIITGTGNPSGPVISGGGTGTGGPIKHNPGNVAIAANIHLDYLVSLSRNSNQTGHINHFIGEGNTALNQLDGTVTRNNLILGNNNVVQGTGSFVVGNNLSITESGTVAFATFNLISAGVDEVLGEFDVTGTTNLRSGGLDVVRGLGGNSTISLINAGKVV